MGNTFITPTNGNGGKVNTTVVCDVAHCLRIKVLFNSLTSVCMTTIDVSKPK
jgi:hypothetical protein